jgi:hypothetical protein
MITKIFYYITYLFYNKKKLRFKGYTDNIILNEISSIQSFSIPSSFFCKALSELNNAKVVSYYLTLKPFGLICKFLLNIFNPFSSHHIYKSFSYKILYPHYNQINHKKIFKKFKSKDDILNLKYKGIQIGDLVYDEYLARYKLPTIDLNSKQFSEFIKIVEKFLLFWEQYLKQNKVKAVVTSHSVYLMGLLNRLAIIHNIPSYVATPSITSKLTKKKFIRWSDQNLYPYQFRKFNTRQQKKLIKLSKENLNSRLAGNIDYRYKMSNPINPVFDGKTVIKKNNHKNKNYQKILIVSHCLSDAPHVYGKTIFPDFHEWLNFLGRISLKKQFKNYLWYIKPHPAFYKKERFYYNSLVKKYKNFQLIQENITHNFIINELNIDYVLTVFGSVAHEYPLFDIPVISAGNNPHSGYKFSINPKNKYDYEKYLLNLNKIDLKINKEKIYEFYGMHHLIDLPFYDELNIYFNSVKNHQDIDIYFRFIKNINSRIEKEKIITYQNFIKNKYKRRLTFI